MSCETPRFLEYSRAKGLSRERVIFVAPPDHSARTGAPMTRGRKTKQESRSIEFRQRLIVWRQTPESSRSSLRTLATELNTSHQLLAHYLDDLDVWQAKENCRKAKDSIQEIRARAESEKRSLAPWEEQQIRAKDRASMHFLINSVVIGAFKKWEGELEQDVKEGRPPTAQAGRLLQVFAKRGNQQAQTILEKYFPKTRRGRQ